MPARKSIRVRFIKQSSLLKKDILAEVFACDYRMTAPKLRGWRRKIKAGLPCRLLGGGQVQLGDGDARNAPGGRVIHYDDFVRREHIISNGLGVTVLKDQGELGFVVRQR